MTVVRVWGSLVLALGVGCRLRFDERAPADADAADAAAACTGHDEDGDAVPDACDVCPTTSDSAQGDGDRDGVGDACDPRPLIAGDYVQMIDLHTAPSMTYTQHVGTTSWQPDALRLGSDPTFGSTYIDLPVLPSRVEVRALVISTSMTQDRWFGLWYNRNASFTEKVFATGNQLTTEQAGAFYLKEENGTGSRFSATVPGPARFDGHHFTLIVDTNLVTGGADRLTVIEENGVPATTTLAIQIGRHTGGILEVQRATVDVESFVAYAIR